MKSSAPPGAVPSRDRPVRWRGAQAHKGPGSSLSPAAHSGPQFMRGRVPVYAGRPVKGLLPCTALCSPSFSGRLRKKRGPPARWVTEGYCR